MKLFELIFVVDIWQVFRYCVSLVYQIINNDNKLKREENVKNLYVQLNLNMK